MVNVTMNPALPWRLIIPEGMYSALHQHLFPGDCDEHGAVIAAGISFSPRCGTRLLARDLHLAEDGRDYVAGTRGYRMLKAEFVTERTLLCRDERLVYLAVHNHSGTDAVAFSSNDFRSHERGYPALLDVARGMPVGALVFAERAIAGDIWLPGGARVQLAGASVIGKRLRRLSNRPLRGQFQPNPKYDRQSRLFGDSGQQILRQTRVGIIGLGGVGSLLAEYLGHLGVGDFLLIDPDRIELSNLPRVVGATRLDAFTWFAHKNWPQWVQAMGRRLSRPKVKVARRVIRRANHNARVNAVFGDMLDTENAALLLDCDYLFLAADTMRARLLFNAIVHQYLIPGAQIGAKVRVDAESGKILDVFSVARPVTPESGCLLCNGLINSAKLQQEGQTEKERQAQCYVEDAEIVAPSVITLNATAAARAADDFLFYITGLSDADASSDYIRFSPLRRELWSDKPCKQPTCLECGHASRTRLARGDMCELPTLKKPSRA